MITFEDLRKTSENGATRLTASLTIDDARETNAYKLWLEVDDKYAYGLVDDRIDGFVVAILSYAIKFKHDIKFEIPITSLLKQQIERDFFCVICQHQPELYHPKLIGPTVEPIISQKVIAAMGLSCGVDCLFTVKNRFLETPAHVRYFFMTDAHVNITSPSVEESKNRFRALSANSQALADELRIPLVVAHTNWGKFSIPGLSIANNTTYCNCFAALCLQKLFSLYFIASGGPIVDFGVKYLKHGIFRTDCSNYDLISLGAFSIPSIRFIVDGLETRVAKIKDLMDWPIAQRHLDVCECHRSHTVGNGTYDCHKCMHTVCEIISQGGYDGLAKFSSVFDVEYVKNHKAEYLAYAICQRLERSEVGLEVWPCRARFEANCIVYIKAAYIIFRKLMRKVSHKKSDATKWIDI